ncbi:MAG: hypothetical protein QOJ16_4669 [Acidobacteriota bacterium]|jgi:hypothetical protein|nr:hypothetical protein [Acidobacteriota bacterium]
MIDQTRMTALHQRAMEQAQEALTTSDSRLARELSRSAFEKEREAAESLPSEPGQEPTRAILYRSAAMLALDCRDDAEAGRLARAGLAGSPPDDVRAELREILAGVERSSPGRSIARVFRTALALVLSSVVSALDAIRSHR